MAKKDRGRTGRNSPQTPFPPRLYLGSDLRMAGIPVVPQTEGYQNRIIPLFPLKEKVHKKIMEYSDGLSVLISNYEVWIELLFQDLKIRLWVFLKKSSNFGQKTQPTFTFCKIITGFIGMLSPVMVFFRYNPGIFKVTHQPVVGNAEVSALKRRKKKFSEPIFSLSVKAKELSTFFI